MTGLPAATRRWLAAVEALGISLDAAEIPAGTKTAGYAAGGTPPFGHVSPVPVLADAALEDATPWIAAGTPTTAASIGLDDLPAASGAGGAPRSHPG